MVPHRARKCLRLQRVGRHAQRGDELEGPRLAELRPLADGGSARGDARRGAGLPRSALSPAAAPSLRPPPRETALHSRPLMTVRIAAAPPQKLGAVPHGIRSIIPVTGGDFEGPRLRGEVL